MDGGHDLTIESLSASEAFMHALAALLETHEIASLTDEKSPAYIAAQEAVSAAWRAVIAAGDAHAALERVRHLGERERATDVVL
jgi:hypothetical protein